MGSVAANDATGGSLGLKQTPVALAALGLLSILERSPRQIDGLPVCSICSSHFPLSTAPCRGHAPRRRQRTRRPGTRAASRSLRCSSDRRAIFRSTMPRTEADRVLCSSATGCVSVHCSHLNVRHASAPVQRAPRPFRAGLHRAGRAWRWPVCGGARPGTPNRPPREVHSAVPLITDLSLPT